MSKVQCGITSQKSIKMQARRSAKNAAGSVLLLLDLFLLSERCKINPGLFNRTKSCVWQFRFIFRFRFRFLPKV